MSVSLWTLVYSVVQLSPMKTHHHIVKERIDVKMLLECVCDGYHENVVLRKRFSTWYNRQATSQPRVPGNPTRLPKPRWVVLGLRDVCKNTRTERIDVYVPPTVLLIYFIRDLSDTDRVSDRVVIIEVLQLVIITFIYIGYKCLQMESSLRRPMSQSK